MKKNMPEIIYAMLSVNLQRAIVLSLYNPLSRTNIPNLQKEYQKVEWSKLALKSKLPRIFIKYLDTIDQVKHKIKNETDTSTMYINYALVITITSFEVFMKDLFIFYINEDKKIKKKIINSNKRTSFKKINEYLNNKITLGDLISENYNFQNLKSIKEAYKEFLGIDISQIFLDIKKFSSLKKIKDVGSYLDKYIKLRHKIIHEAFLDKSLSLKKLDKLQAIIQFIGLELTIGKTLKKIIKHN